MSKTPAISPGQFTSFGDLLKYLRRRAGLTQRDLSIAVGYSDAQISRLEQNQRLPDATSLAAQFVPALQLEKESEWVKRLLELAAQSRQEALLAPESDATPTPHNLPIQLTSFIGREKEIAEVRRLLSPTPVPSASPVGASRQERRRGGEAGEGVRLLTLTGPGGTGKTRLALRAAASLLTAFADGVWFVELAPVADPALVPQTIAAVMDVRERQGVPVLKALIDRLRDSQTLLLIDNCEHLIETCAQIAEALLQACPQARILATSRETLSLAGEATIRVASLALPDDYHPISIEALLQYEAVQLFVDRAAAAMPDFQITPDNASAIAQVCQRLDGIPLAIELAAAKVNMLRVEEIAARLSDRFRLLRGGSRTVLPRHQTLRAAMDWSYDLLRAEERLLLIRLSVFAGGWALEAAESICGGEGIEAGDVLDTLTRLVGKSLVIAEREPGQAARYRLLETIREYGSERLAKTELAAMTHRRHADYYMALAERADPLLESPQQAIWLQRLQAEYDNLRVALDWLADAGESESGMRLASALWRFWEIRGHLTEGRARLAQMLALPAATPRTKARMRALYVAGVLADAQRDYPAARTLFDENLAITREIGDPASIGSALNNLGNVVNVQGDYPMAEACYGEALQLWRAIGDLLGIGWTLKGLANVALRQGDFAKARALNEEEMVLWRQIGNAAMIAVALNDLGIVANAQGDYAAARSAYEQSLAIFQDMGNHGAAAIALNNLGNVVSAQGDYAAARALYEQSLTIVQALGDMRGIARLLESFAALAVAQAQPDRAVRLAGAAAALRETLGAPLSMDEQRRVEQTTETARQLLPRPEVDSAWLAGQTLTLAQALDYAVEGGDST